MTRLPLLVLALVFVCNALASPWPDLKTDKPQDPRIVSGALPNGLRYLILRNAEPKDRLSLRLVVAAGSLQERDNERGLAHFVEHMVFRGTKQHPGESLANLLQHEGLGFGPDNTAFTNFDHTIYHLELPNTREETLRLGLSVFSEYATSVTFNKDLIETERGVVLSEKATRDTPESRFADANISFRFPDSLHARRAVIGLEDQIKKFTREDFISFYDAWYRPECLAIVAVGDADPEVIKGLISEIFSPMEGRGPARPEPAGIIPESASHPEISVFTDPSLVGVSISFAHPIKKKESLETHQDRIEILQRYLAFGIFQRRLNRLAQDLGDDFVAPYAGIRDSLPGWDEATFSAASRISSWSKLAAYMEQEHRRALAYGFDETEFELGRKMYLEMLDADIRSAPSRHSEYLSSMLVWSLLSGTTVSSPEQNREEFLDPLTQVTLEQVNEEFRSVWEKKPLHVTIGGYSALNITPNQAAEVLNKSRATPVEQRAKTEAKEFGYNAFGIEGKFVKDDYQSDLDIHLAAFENNVRLNFKPTTFEKDTVYVTLRINGGKMSLKKDQNGLDLFAANAFLAGGLGKHSPSEMADILIGRNINIGFNVYNDAFLLSARCSRRDLLLCLKIMAAQLTDPGYRPEALTSSRAAYGGLFSKLLSTPGGPLRIYLEQTLYNQDKRWGIPFESDYYRYSLADLAKWMKPHLAKGALELSVVGDTSWSEVSGNVARTFGALPERAAVNKTGSPPKLAKPPAGPITYTVSPSMTQAALCWAFPTPSIKGYHDERRCRMLAEVIEERMRQCLREDLGSAYAPNAQFLLDEATPGCGYFMLYADVDAKRAKEAVTVLRNELDRLAKEGFTEDEFERVKAPFLRSRQDDLRANGYWAYTVLADAQQRPERLSAARDRAKDTASITKSEIEAVYRQFISRDKGFLFISEPSPGNVWHSK